MEQILYHGSENIIEHPSFRGGRSYNDYGHGFYCTKEEALAAEWAVTQTHDGFVNRYSLRTDGLRVMDLNRHGVLAWLTVLLENRTFHTVSPLAAEAMEYLTAHFHVDLRRADVITGYRADDSYFSFAQDFISGAISLRQLSEAMRLGKLGEQYVIRSKKAYAQLRFLDAQPVRRSDYLAKRKARDFAARRAYFDRTRAVRRKGDIFITHIMDEGMEPDDARLQ